VRQAVVVVREDRPGDQRLVAYVVGEGSGAPGAEALREAARRALPGYMVPAAFVFVPSLPLTPNGKIDRKALPAVGKSRPAPPAIAEKSVEDTPATRLAAALCRILAGVLGRASMGANDDFFRLGGRSLEAVTAVARIRQELSLNASVMGLFEHPTPAALAESLASNAGGGAPWNQAGQP
jgi:hypothetical protein